MVFRHPGLEHYQRLIEAARSRLADLELDYGVEKSKVDSVRSRLFGALRPYYQERDRLRLLIQYRLDHTLMELRSLYEHLQARILELIEPSSLKLRRAENPRHPPRQPGLRSLPVRRERRRRDRHHRRRAAGGVGERN